MCQDRVGQFHHSKAKNRIESMVFLYGISLLACWLAGFPVSDTPECQVQSYDIFFS